MPALDYDRIAHLYDACVRTELDVPFLLQEARQASGPVLELRAGTGRVSLPLLEAGIDLPCVDSLAAMLDILRTKLRRRRRSAELVPADVCALSLHRQFDLVFIPSHSLAEIIDPADQRRALECIRAHLSSHGRFLCTRHHPPVRLRAVTGPVRKLGDLVPADGQGTLSLSSGERYDPHAQLVTGTQFYEVRDHNGVVLWRTSLDIRFRLHTEASLASRAESAGLARVALHGDYTGSAFEAETSPFILSVWRRAESNGAVAPS